MNFVKKLGTKLGFSEDKSAEEIAQILPISDQPVCCEEKECLNSFNKKCFKLDDESTGAPLWESAKPFDLHILVSTGEQDWQHDAFDKSGTVLASIAKFDYSKYGSDKKNVTSLPNPIMDPAYRKLQKADILIMPYFVWVKGVTTANVETVMTTVLGGLVKEKKSLEEIPTEIAGATVSADVNRSYIFLCSHKTRDKRCGRTAPIMKKEFEAQLRETGHYRDISDTRPDGVCVCYVNHVGGHKFAANVLVYNKGGEFAWFARCSPLNVKPILQETVLKGKAFVPISRTVRRYTAVTW